MVADDSSFEIYDLKCQCQRRATEIFRSKLKCIWSTFFRCYRLSKHLFAVFESGVNKKDTRKLKKIKYFQKATMDDIDEGQIASKIEEYFTSYEDLEVFQ